MGNPSVEPKKDLKEMSLVKKSGSNFFLLI
jgi:hypothetical protein